MSPGHHVAKLETCRLNAARLSAGRGVNICHSPLKSSLIKRAGGAESTTSVPCFGARRNARGYFTYIEQIAALHTFSQRSNTRCWLLTFPCKTPCKEAGRFSLHATGSQTTILMKMFRKRIHNHHWQCGHQRRPPIIRLDVIRRTEQRVPGPLVR